MLKNSLSIRGGVGFAYVSKGAGELTGMLSAYFYLLRGVRGSFKNSLQNKRMAP